MSVGNSRIFLAGFSLLIGTCMTPIVAQSQGKKSNPIGTKQSNPIGTKQSNPIGTKQSNPIGTKRRLRKRR